MNKTTILFAGFDNTASVVEKFTKNWIVTIADSAESAIEKFQQFHQDVVVAGELFNETETQKLNKLFVNQQPNLVFISAKENKPDPELILQEVETKRKQTKPLINYNDDALGNAGLNIQIQ